MFEFLSKAQIPFDTTQYSAFVVFSTCIYLDAEGKYIERNVCGKFIRFKMCHARYFIATPRIKN